MHRRSISLQDTKPDEIVLIAVLDRLSVISIIRKLCVFSWLFSVLDSITGALIEKDRKNICTRVQVR